MAQVRQHHQLCSESVTRGAQDAKVSAKADNDDISDKGLVYFVRHVLASVQDGITDNYEQLVGYMYCKGRHDEPELLTSLKALSGAVTCIDVFHHRALLSSIFGMSLWNYGPDVREALAELVVLLAASCGKPLDSCLNMLVNNFMAPASFSNYRGFNRKQEVLDQVHRTIEKIYDLIPLAPTRLVPILAQKMPTMNKKDHSIVEYVENLLKLESSSVGEVAGDMILRMVIERLRDLDLEIEWDDIPQDESSRSNFAMELEDPGGGAVDTASNGDELPKGSLDQENLLKDSHCELLDNLMVLTFKHLESCQNAGRLGEVFESLFESFENLILNTYKSKFAQFVMFYVCSLDSDYCGEQFASKLADIFLSNSKPPLTRMSAVAYLASFLSRGKFLSTSLVARILKRLVDACADYCRACNDDVKPGSHRVFYSGCQAIMYVLCFRMAAIVDVPRLRALFTPLESVLTHRLNPLMVCLPSVVTEFLKQAKAACLFTVSEAFIFEELQESELSRAFGGRERLDMFFPFDPCLLKTSESYIRRDYVHWGDVRKYVDEAECDANGVQVIVFNDDDLQEEEEDEEEEDNEMMCDDK